MRGLSTAGSTLSISPTKPSCAELGEGRAVRRWPSIPDSPTAVAPALLIKDTSASERILIRVGAGVEKGAGATIDSKDVLRHEFRKGLLLIFPLAFMVGRDTGK
nr:hypothetical protein Iba_chr11cCG4000 [Ipomoea batatas]